LKQVLQFKATLEDQRAGLIETIEDLSGFETRLRWHLSRWLIDHESPPRPSSVTDVESDEQTLPQPHPLDEDPESLNRYGLFLQRQGMLEDAEATHRSALDLLKDVGESAAVAIAHGNLGVIHSRQRRFDESEAMFRKALATCEHLGRKKGMAASYCGLGLVYRGRDDLFRSEEMFREALGIELALDRAAGIAFCYGNLALLADLRGQAEEAERMRRLARAVGEEPEYPLGELFPQEI
jgi:tetratricopeptide (TPR) repeat protein